MIQHPQHPHILIGEKPPFPRKPEAEGRKQRISELRYYPHESQRLAQVNADLDGQFLLAIKELNKKGGTVVDAGCGTGAYLAEAAKNHPNVQFLGFSGHYYPEWAGRKLPNLKFMHASLDELKGHLKESPADLIISELGALDNPEKTQTTIAEKQDFFHRNLHDLKPGLKAGGRIMFFPSQKPHGPDPEFAKRLAELRKVGYKIGFNKNKRWFSVERQD